MGIAILGPVRIDGGAPSLGRRDRVVLAALAVRPGEVLGTDRLADALWGDEPPASAAKVVQGCIARLRKVLGPQAIATDPLGYRLTLPLDEIDAQRFVRGLEKARDVLATSADADRAAFELADALGLWRGEALEELEAWDPGRIERGRLDELHHEAEELYVEAALRGGHWDTVLARAAAMVQEQPLRERRWALLTLAQYQAGRQSEALATLRRVRALLSRELGLDPGPELEQLEGAVLRQDPALVERAALPEPSPTCPYRGLLPYDTDDADTFFGRDRDVAECLRRLAGSRALAVVGPSGSGKSSMVRAGIVASLRRDGRPVVVMTPGPHPMAMLTGVARLEPGATLVVDQCEEVYSLCQNLDERNRFLDRLVSHVATGALVVVLRADHLANVSAHREFAGLVEQSLHLMAAMREDDLREAIERPARESGLSVEPALVQTLVQEVTGNPGALPMMSHALQATWQRREGRTLTLGGYQASGGIHEAVARSAEEIYAGLGEDRQAMLRGLLLRLVTPSAEGEPVRARVPRRLVATDPDHEQMVDLLVRSRLVTSDQGAVEIAHEALARAWPRLREWLEQDREGQRILHHLTTVADSWETLGRPDSELYRGVRLARALDWRARTGPELTTVEEVFLEASDSLSRAELRSAQERARHQARVSRRLRHLLITAVVLLLAATGAGLYAAEQTRTARNARTTAERAAIDADARRVGARALLSDEISLSLLLVVAGVRLADSPESGVNLLAAVGQHPHLVRSAPAGGGYVDFMDVSRDGRWLAAADDHNRMHLYDRRTQRVLRSYDFGSATADAQAFVVPAFAPDNRTLAAVTMNPSRRPVRLLDPRTMTEKSPRLIWPEQRPARGVDLQFSADGRYLAVSFRGPGVNPDVAAFDDPAFLLVWDLHDPGGAPRRISLGNATNGLALSPDGATVYSAWPLSAYDVRSGRRLWRHPTARSFISLDIDPAGRLLVLEDHATERVTDMLLVDARTGHTLRRLRGHQDQPRDLTFSNGGRLLASHSHDGELIVWDVASGRPLERWKTFEQGWSVGFSPDDRTVYTGGSDGMLRSWDLSGRDTFLTRTATVPGSYLHADIAPGGRRVAFRWADTERGGEHGWIRFVDPGTGAATPARPLQVYPGEWSPGVWRSDGHQYASHAGCIETGSCTGSGVTILDPSSGRRVSVREVPGVETLYSMAYVDGDRGLLVGDQSGSTHVLDAETLSQAKQFKVPSDCCATPITAAGETVLLYDDSEDGATERWRLVDVSTGRVLRRGDLGFRVYSSAASPDGTTVAATGQGGEVVAIDLATGRQRKGSTGLGADVRWLRYSADGTRLVTGAADGTVSLWNAETLQLLGTVAPPGDSQDVPSAADFVGRSNDVTIATYSGQMYRWDTDPERSVDFACAMAGRNLTPAEWAEYLPEQPYERVCPASS